MAWKSDIYDIGSLMCKMVPLKRLETDNGYLPTYQYFLMNRLDKDNNKDPQYKHE